MKTLKKLFFSSFIIIAFVFQGNAFQLIDDIRNNPKLSSDLKEILIDKITSSQDYSTIKHEIFIYLKKFPNQEQFKDMAKYGLVFSKSSWIMPDISKKEGFIFGIININHIVELSNLKFIIMLYDGHKFVTKNEGLWHKVLNSIGPHPFIHDKIDESLLKLNFISNILSIENGIVWAKKRGMGIKNKMVKVIIDSKNENPISENFIISNNGKISATYKGSRSVWFPINNLLSIVDDLPDNFYIKEPVKPIVQKIESEAPSVTGVDDYLGLYDGENIIIGVIDTQFDNLHAAEANDDIPKLGTVVDTIDYTGEGMESGNGDHGTACLEVIYDMAPGASFRAYKISDKNDFNKAIDDGLKNGVNIFSHSLAWFTMGWHDDEGPICEGANKASNAGALFITSAGNYANDHWQGNFVDNDNDDFHEWNGTDEFNRIDVPVGWQFTIYLEWNHDGLDWDNYDIFLYGDENGNNLIESKESIFGSSERLTITATQTSYWIAVKRKSGDGEFELFVPNVSQVGQLEYRIITGSTPSPVNATGENVISVAAVDVNDFELDNPSIMWYSSRGPTNDNAQVPTITGPTNVSTFSSGGIFGGTSCAAPNVAGAAAVLWSTSNDMNAEKVRNNLFDWSLENKDWGIDGRDLTFGFGGLYLEPIGVDVALVIDRSGSMGYYGYMEPAKSNAKTFVGIMEIGDHVSVVSFNENASVDFPLTLIDSEETKNNAKSAINAIISGGMTSIGAGIQTGQAELDKGNTDVHQGMVLLSDGFENTPPMVDDVLPSVPENTDIYTIALGPNSDQALLNSIANQTGGFYSYSPTTAGLQAIYDAIRSQVTGEQVIASFSGNIEQGQTITNLAQIDGSVNKAKFTTTWEGSDIDLELKDPNGRIINPEVAETDPNMTFSSGETYEYYIIYSPVPGEWTLKIMGKAIPNGGESYYASVTGKADLVMNVYFDKPEYQQGQHIIITAEIKEDHLPITGATVTVEVQIPTQSNSLNMLAKGNFDESIDDPNGNPNNDPLYESTDGKSILNSEGIILYSSTTFTLFDDGAHGDGSANDGVYSNYFRDTNFEGSYTFKVKASGTSPSSGDFTREALRSTVVLPRTEYFISGKISYYHKEHPVPDCQIDFLAEGITVVDSTDEIGEYSTLVPQGNVTIIPSKTGDTRLGITGRDITMIYNYIHGKIDLTDDQKIAADVTRDGKVDTQDLYAISYYHAKNCNQDVCDSAYTGTWIFRNEQGDSSTTILLSSDVKDINFTAYLLGDVDGSWIVDTTDSAIVLPKSSNFTSNSAQIPENYYVSQNFPNPFNPKTFIQFGLPEAGMVNIDVFDVKGQKINTIFSGYLSAGHHLILFDGTNLASGVYFYKVTIGNHVVVKRMLLMK